MGQCAFGIGSSSIMATLDVMLAFFLFFWWIAGGSYFTVSYWEAAGKVKTPSVMDMASAPSVRHMASRHLVDMPPLPWTLTFPRTNQKVMDPPAVLMATGRWTLIAGPFMRSPGLQWASLSYPFSSASSHWMPRMQMRRRRPRKKSATRSSSSRLAQCTMHPFPQGYIHHHRTHMRLLYPLGSQPHRLKLSRGQ